MPKVKKTKIVSLVAYESGAESDNEDVTMTESSEEESSKDESETNETQEEQENSNQDLINEETLSNSSSKLNQPVDKNELVDTVLSEKTSVETEIQSTTTEAVSLASPESKYTLENGFPPGCVNIKLPTPPSAPCSQALQSKIIQVRDRMERYNYSINNDIYSKKSFKNPSIYEKLIEVYGIDEYGSSFPSHIEDLKASCYSFYDELDEAQRQSWIQRDKEKQAKTKVEIATGVKKK